MKNQKKMPLTAIVKPTKNCNLKCRYCYEGKTYSNVINDFTLNKVISEVIKYNDEACIQNSYDKRLTEFLWHGGEPLLLGRKFYEKIINIEKECIKNYKGHMIMNGIQSNVTLLDQELWNYLNKEGFVIGSSLDGYKELHDKQRIDKTNKGTFDRVMNSINIARPSENLFSDIGTIVVMTRDKLDKIPDIYNFFKKNKIRFDINYPCITGNAKENSESLTITPIEWGNAVIQLFDIWFDDKTEPFVEISELAKYSAGVLRGEIASCVFSGSCRERYISVNPNGDVYPCGKFGSDDNFKLGNINTESLEEIMQSKTQKYLMTRDIENIDDCKTCDYKTMCNGGCMYNAYLIANDPLKKDPLCEGYKMIYGHIKLRLIEKLSEKIESIESKNEQ